MTQGTAAAFDRSSQLNNADCNARIDAARKQLKDRAVILGHHYQRTDVYKHADLAGDSLRLSKPVAKADARHIVFCGVHFIAEVADILSKPDRMAILPDMAAGCSMADMADFTKVQRAWPELSQLLDAERQITPIAFINSAADLKAFCGEHGGIVCTSSNARSILERSFKRRRRVLFFPDQHLGRWSGHTMGIAAEQMPVWDLDEWMGGLSGEQIESARIVLWKGH